MSDTAESKVRRYAERRYRSPDQRLVNALESRIIRRYLGEVVEPGCTVLDMPCGYGRFTGHLIEQGAEVVAADVKPAMLRLAGQRLGRRLSGICLRSDRLPFADDSFDVALCVRLMQHLRTAEARRRTLAELGRVARRGVVVTVYALSPLHRAMHEARRLKRLCWYDPAALEADLRAAGLELLQADRPLPGLHAQWVLQLAPRSAAPEARRGLRTED